MSEEIFYDLFHQGRWIGMAKGADEDEAKRMAARSLPQLLGRFTLVHWHGRLHPDNCVSSGGNVPDPIAEPSFLTPDLATEAQMRELYCDEDDDPNEPMQEVVTTHDGDWRREGYYWRFHEYPDPPAVQTVSVEPQSRPEPAQGTEAGNG